MQNTIAYGLLLPFILFFAMIIPDFVMYSNVAVKANHVATNAIEIAEKAGGFDYSESGVNVDLNPYIESELKRYNLNPDKWKVEYTTGKIQYNQPLSITIQGQYDFMAFNMLWDDSVSGVLEMKGVPINVTRSGIGQVFFR